MPLPRFERIPEENRSAILAVARRHFAEHGRDGASLLAVAEDARLSRSAFYNYFDGKDDLFDTVRLDTLARVGQALGHWEAQPDEASFWTAFAHAHRRLVAALEQHPDDRAILAASRQPSDANAWMHGVFQNAVALGLVDTDPGAAFLEAATSATIEAADATELAAPGTVSETVASDRSQPALGSRSFLSRTEPFQLTSPRNARGSSPILADPRTDETPR